MPYVAVARRSGEGYALTVEDVPGLTAQVDTIAEAESVVRGLLSTRLHVPADDIEVRVRVVIED